MESQRSLNFLEGKELDQLKRGGNGWLGGRSQVARHFTQGGHRQEASAGPQPTDSGAVGILGSNASV